MRLNESPKKITSPPWKKGAKEEGEKSIESDQVKRSAP